MSMIEDQIDERQAAMSEHLGAEQDLNRAILEALPVIGATDEEFARADEILKSGGDQVMDIGTNYKLSLGFDGHYHLRERSANGTWHEYELPTESDQQAA